MMTLDRQPLATRLAWTLSFAVTAAACTVSPSSDNETSGTGSEGSDTEDPSELGGLATGLRITEVAVNQGVGVAVADGGAWVDGPDRNARLIAGRPSLVQVRYQRDPAGTPRPIDVWLHLDHPTLELEPLVTSVAEADTELVVDFVLDPALGHTDPGVGFRVELRELDDAPPAEGQLDVPVSPASGFALIGFEELELVPEIVLVPIHAPGDPAPNLDAELFRAQLFAWLPATEVVLSVHAPVEAELDVLADGFATVNDVVDQDQPAPDVSYVGVVHDPDGALIDDAIAVVIDEPSMDDNRIAVLATVGDDLIDGENLAFLLYSHHTMRHVDCPDAEPYGSDPDYPHADGKIGVWGWDMANDRMFDPAETYDLSTWCEPRWVSDYTWSEALESLRITSAW